jgi:hypothetical protein
MLLKEKRPYLLVGPGRWGSADRWLGIPVQWKNISGVRAIIELRNQWIKADPSQGSHFFQNITSLGIHYLTVTEESGSEDHLIGLAGKPNRRGGDDFFTPCAARKALSSQDRRPEREGIIIASCWIDCNDKHFSL